ncbi:MAG: MFS transporter [Bacteroidota bacterium]|nr:MFS transporter [Bacteroidota bacterium]
MQNRVDKKINLKSNRNRFIIQSFFLVAATASVEPATVMPLIVDYFNGSEVLTGLLMTLMKGGAVVMQMWAAFHARNKPRVIPYLRRVFTARFGTWFALGIVMLMGLTASDSVVLILFSVLLFLFSFSAGFGVIYYQEISGKSFTKEYRGKMFAMRQIASGLAGIAAGGISGYVLANIEKPNAFAYLFMVSGIIMATGFAVFWNFKEPVKIKVDKKFSSFKEFLGDAVMLLRADKELIQLVLIKFFSFGFMLIMPFVILHAKNNFGIEGKDVGIIISMLMVGAVLSSVLWGMLTVKNRNRCIVIVSFVLAIAGVVFAFYGKSIEALYPVYFLFGAARDGFKLSVTNILLTIAPEEKRPAYIAVQNNLSSLGLFLPIIGGIIYKYIDFSTLSLITIGFLILGLLISFRLRRI